MITQHNKEKLTPLRSLVAQLKYNWPIPVAVRSTAWVCGRSLAGIAGLTPVRGHGCLSVVNVVCCAGRSLCDGPNPRPEESYLVCVIECDRV